MNLNTTRFYFYTGFVMTVVYMLLPTTVLAQRPFFSIESNSTVHLKSITDTLIPASYMTGTLTIDSALAGGYVCGTNAYNDLEKAQIFRIDDSIGYFVNGCALDIGRLFVSDTTGTLSIKLYDLDAQGYSNDSLINTGAPGTAFTTLHIPVKVLTEGQINYFLFPNPMWVTRSYAIGIGFENFSSNQMGLVSSTHGDAGGTQLAWERMQDGHWYAMLKTWPFDADMGIFALRDASSAGTFNLNYQYNILIYPNPSYDGILNIEAPTLTNYNAVYHIYNITGSSLNTGTIECEAPAQTQVIDISYLSPGTYFLNLKLLNSNFVKKFVVF